MLTWLAPVLRAEGLNVYETPGWSTRGKDVMNPKVLINHHTASRPAQDEVLDRILINGRVDLPGPLCQVHLTRTGQCRMIAAGMANHAGIGSWQGLKGNAIAIGIEAANDGRGEPWPLAQTEAYDRASAAILRYLRRDASWMCGHKEWATPPGRKVDPLGIQMSAMRQRVQYIIDNKDNIVIIHQGLSGYHIVPWQRALNKALIANSINHPQLALDGVFGPLMKTAVAAYQGAAQVTQLVPEIGALDDYTRDLLVEFTREGD